ncbi:hypothetical protein [Actinokineospora sp. UTMC 2448]|uniref:hypothetical protein n=1 Tax=Actinokineospora sp. UTMC 2448 TaxID=2268449 RepID=UPI002164E9C8|nr:hypothetical protein [Actinokineospora sp. UTMC 2448]UVS79140.1 hypothetical protein Actkin_02886 [Actinokineospora sp. UTMC 2448]
MRRPEPAAWAAALMIAALAASATAARAPSPWWALPVFAVMAALVLGVHALLSRGPAPPESTRTPPLPAEPLDRARALVRRASALAGEIRAQTLTVPEADAVATNAAITADAAHRLACLAARSPDSAPAALTTLTSALEDMRTTAENLTTPTGIPVRHLVETLTAIRASIEDKETEIRTSLRGHP